MWCRWLEDDRVAGREGGPDLPQRHHERVVPWSDLTDDADRLTTDVGGETLHVLSGRLALEKSCGSGEEPHLIGSDLDLFVGDHLVGLAGVGAFGCDDFVAVRFDGVGELEECSLPHARRRLAPGLECSLCGFDGGVDVFLRGDRRTPDHTLVHGVDQVECFRRG